MYKEEIIYCKGDRELEQSVESHSLEIFKTQLDNFVFNLVMNFL